MLGANMDDSSGDDRGAHAALQDLNSVLTVDEKLEAWAIQRRLFALAHRRVALGATSGRFLALTRPLFGGFDLVDVRWQDLKDVHVHVGVLGASLQLTAFTGGDLASASGPTVALLYEGLRKDQAQALYRICQAHDQAWREKRRVRDLEELRARSGGIQLGSSSLGNTQASDSDATGRLRSAKSMLDAGLLTDSEYEALKAKILSNL
jgi:Short C-terminal domain